QPALFGNMLVLLAIARHRDGAPCWHVYAAALIAVGLGRGYSSFIILGLWALWEAIIALRSDAVTLGVHVGAVLRADATRVTILAVAWGAFWIGYNVVTEANTRGVSVAETSIVDSALRRLPVIEEVEARGRDDDVLPSPPEFARDQFERLLRWALPLSYREPGAWAWVGGLALMLGGLALARRTEQPGVALLTAGWGPLWIIFMVNLTHGHEYTMMYAIGTLLVLYAGLLTLLPRTNTVRIGAVIVALLIFGLTNALVRAEVGDTRAEYTYDYQRIDERIEGDRRGVYVNISNGRCVIENDFCYVLGFYLTDHYMGGFNEADYVLERLPYYHAEPVALPPDDTDGLLLMHTSLTPENTTAHLFSIADAERRNIPDDAREITRFGEALTLQAWSVPSGVDVPACGRVRFESWWRPTEQPDANYSMLLAMQTAEGGLVTDSNSDLTHLATAVWQPDYFHIDARHIDVPCDTPPGSYPLVMSVYEPGAPQSLTAFAPDGTPTGPFFYLTNINVTG
ncbi:MAG: hypothetical protein AAF125_00140, partial [Chloroflexota bacterium]